MLLAGARSALGRVARDGCRGSRCLRRHPALATRTLEPDAGTSGDAVGAGHLSRHHGRPQLTDAGRRRSGDRAHEADLRHPPDSAPSRAGRSSRRCPWDRSLGGPQPAGARSPGAPRGRTRTVHGDIPPGPGRRARARARQRAVRGLARGPQRLYRQTERRNRRRRGTGGSGDVRTCDRGLGHSPAGSGPGRWPLGPWNHLLRATALRPTIRRTTCCCSAFRPRIWRWRGGHGRAPVPCLRLRPESWRC